MGENKFNTLSVNLAQTLLVSTFSFDLANVFNKNILSLCSKINRDS